MLSSTIRSAITRQVVLRSCAKLASPIHRIAGTKFAPASSAFSSSLHRRHFNVQPDQSARDDILPNTVNQDNSSSAGRNSGNAAGTSTGGMGSMMPGGMKAKMRNMAAKLDPTGMVQRNTENHKNEKHKSDNYNAKSSHHTESPHERAERMNSEYGLKDLNEGENQVSRSSHDKRASSSHRRGNGSRRNNQLMSRDSSDLFEMNPFGFHLSPRGLFAVPQEIDDVFARVFDGSGSDSSFDSMMSKFESSSPVSPIVLDVAATPTSYEVSAQIPGLSKDDIHVKIEHDDGRQYLLIRGDRKQHSKSDSGSDNSKHVYVESSWGLTERRMILPNDAKVNSPKDIHGKLENGVLKLTIPRDEKAKHEDDGTVKIE